MTYIDGFVLAVPTSNKEAYRKMASDASKIFVKHGAIAFLEGWGEDVPQGKVNCLNTAVMKKPDETVMFSWIVWPDRAARDAGNAAVMVEPDLGGPGMEPPFDGSRMIYGGLENPIGEADTGPGLFGGAGVPGPSGRGVGHKPGACKRAGPLHR